MSDSAARKLDDLDQLSDSADGIGGYVAVPMATLIQRKSSLSDLFLKMPSGKMLKVAHKGGAIDKDQLDRFGSKDVRYFYVHREDLALVSTELIRGAQVISGMENIPVDIKTAKFLSIAETVYEELAKLPFTEEALGRALIISNELATSLSANSDLLKAMGAVVDLGEHFARHSLGTVIMSNLIAKQLGWTSPKVISPLTIGAFFHDIGMKELPPELLTKHRIDMTAKEIELYETHPARGVAILNNFPVITADVLRIVQEHHEIPNGQGFPAHLRGERIYLPAKVVSLASVLAHDLFDVLPEDGVVDFDRVRLKIDSIYATMYGSELTKALKKIFI
ncbi:MAG: HD domain-containing protein [Bdellovibrionales bacterium]|nr:HD domain-containing protein [Bdellovibrionales bacterium]